MPQCWQLQRMPPVRLASAITLIRSSKAAYDAWMNCTSVAVDQFLHAMDQQAILYPRFGIAWRAP